MPPDEEDDPHYRFMIFQPPPRWMTDEQIRRYFGLSERAMRRLRMMDDFPKRNAIINKTDRKLVDLFFDEMAGIPTPPSWNDPPDGKENFDD